MVSNLIFSISCYTLNKSCKLAYFYIQYNFIILTIFYMKICIFICYLPVFKYNSVAKLMSCDYTVHGSMR